MRNPMDGLIRAGWIKRRSHCSEPLTIFLRWQNEARLVSEAAGPLSWYRMSGVAFGDTVLGMRIVRRRERNEKD